VGEVIKDGKTNCQTAASKVNKGKDKQGKQKQEQQLQQKQEQQLQQKQEQQLQKK
jgi:hypothetical protein